MHSIIIQARRCVQELISKVTGGDAGDSGERQKLVEDHLATLEDEEVRALEKEAVKRLNPFPTTLAIQAMVRTILAQRMVEQGLLPPSEDGQQSPES